MSECLSQAQSDINLAIDIESQLVGQNRALGVDIQNVNKPDYNDPKVQNHKNKFESWLNEHYEKDGNTSFVLKRKDYDEIRDVLKGVRVLHDANKKFAFKKKAYFLNADNVVQRKVDGVAKQVVFLEQFFELIYELHAVERLHQGITKTFDQVQLKYVGITRKIVKV
jgi:hypothetical protein